jgi:hypothetical protein
LNIEELQFLSAAISEDAIHSQYDISELVHQAKCSEDFPVNNLGTWNDNPIVIQAIKEEVDQFMD